ncbi:MAG: calcium sensor EFh [Deltaproteobacteria bacterium CG17_big_fil_post_rev_8_21_14_2_50_51_6]|nr:MAG: calcium sensor EFh [Gammaproteobacteria bacterium CG22_combo_CG10-13_8_21_14_all_40_8]PIV99167.1 MAG: calcium sensor EFh [Deltaproteobacteria bacterium CG17_big_fil_post_rev_8_21_14_2_50_51_6]
MTAKNKVLQENLQKIRDNFDFFDRDGNGRIDEKEFAELILAIEPHAKIAEIEKGFIEIDADQDGSIDFNEFVSWWKLCWWQY